MPLFYRILVGFLALYGYACVRSWQRVFGTLAIIHWSIYVFVCLLFVAIFLIGKICVSMPPRLSRLFSVIGGYWLAFSLYLILLTAASDIIAMPNRLFQIVAVTPQASLWFGCALIGITCLVIAVGAWTAKHAHVKRYSIVIPTKAAGAKTLNIVMVSDIHLGDLYGIGDVNDLADEINGLSPDLVLIAGDIFDNPYVAAALFEGKDIAGAFAKLKAHYGIYAALGNHDSFEDGEITRAFFAQTPVIILQDESVVIDDCIVLIGRQDACVHDRASAASLVENAGTQLPVVIIDHRPILLDQTMQAGASLLLSGHTHSGQLFPLNIITKALFEVHYGYAQKGGMQIIVSSGYGACTMPVRIGTRSEIVQIRLTLQP